MLSSSQSPSGLDQRTALALLGAFVGMLTSNFVFSTGAFGIPDGAEVSNENLTYLTPTGVTFSIWGIIYSLLAVTIVNVVFFPSANARTFLDQGVCWRLIAAFCLNAIWLPVFVWFQFFILAGFIMATYLVMLVSVYSSVNRISTGSIVEYILYAAGIAMNTSWVVVATFLNLFVVMRNLGEVDSRGVGGSPFLAMATAAVVTVGAVIVGVGLMDPAWACVASWALFGIYKQQTQIGVFPEESQDPTLAKVAMACSAVCFVAAVAGGVRAFRDGKMSLRSIPLSQMDEEAR